MQNNSPDNTKQRSVASACLYSRCFILTISATISPCANRGTPPAGQTNLSSHSGCGAQFPKEAHKPLCSVPTAAPNLCLWTRGIRPGLIFITTPPWPLPYHRSNHHCALSLSGADTWPAPDGHRPAWPLSPAALNWNHRWVLPLPTMNWQMSCSDLGEEK